MGRTPATAGTHSSRPASGAHATKKALSRQQPGDTHHQHGHWRQAPGRQTRGSQPGPRLHWPRTLVAKAQSRLQRQHLRYKASATGNGRVHVFLLDCSASMLTGQGLAQAKGLLVKLFSRAYQQRDQIALISFAGRSAQLRLSPQRVTPQQLALEHHDWLQDLGAGGTTPLQQAISTTNDHLHRWQQQRPGQHYALWLISDGRSPESPQKPLHCDTIHIVDCEQQRVALGQCQQLAARWQAQYWRLPDLLT